MLRIDCDCQGLWELALAPFKLGGLEGALVALPGVDDVVRIRVHNFVFWLNDTRGPLFIRRLIALVLFVANPICCVLSGFLRLLLLSQLLFMSLYLVPDVLLKRSFHLTVIHIIE